MRFMKQQNANEKVLLLHAVYDAVLEGWPQHTAEYWFLKHLKKLMWSIGSLFIKFVNFTQSKLSSFEFAPS